MMDAFNTYARAYRYNLGDLAYSDILEGRRHAIVLPARDWGIHGRPPRMGDWLFLHNCDVRELPSEVIWSGRSPVITLTHLQLRCLGYAPSETGRWAFLSRFEAIYPDLPVIENPKIHFILLRGLTPAEFQRYEQEKAS